MQRSNEPVTQRTDLDDRVAPGAWYVVAVLMLANVSGFVDRQILSLLVVPIKRDLHVTDTGVSLLMGLSFVIFYSLLGLPIGRAVDRGSRRAIVAVGAAVWSLFTMSSGIAKSFGALFAARIGVGIGEATLGPAAVSLIGDSFPRRRLGTAMSVYMLGTFFGSGVAYALGAWVVGALDTPGVRTLPIVGEVFPWQTVFFLVGAPGLLIALLAMTMPEPGRRGAGPDVARGESFATVLRYVRANFRTIGGMSIGFACSAAVNYGIAAWLATFFVRTHGWTIQRAGTLQGALTMTVGVLGTLLGGWLTDRLARRGHADAPLRVGMIGAASMLLFAGLYPVIPSATVAAFLLVPVNLFAAMPWGAANAAIAEAMPPRRRGQGSALYQLIVNLIAGGLGPTSVALLTDRVFANDASLRWSLAVCAVVGMSLALVFLQWARPAFVRTVSSRGAD